MANNRDQLEWKAQGYREGRASMQNEMEFLCITREMDAYRDGREDQKRVQHRYAWLRLFFLIIAASTLGFLLAAATWEFVGARLHL